MAINPATGKEDQNYKTPTGVPLLKSTPQISNISPSGTATATAANAGPAELVESRVSEIAKENSPLMQLAASRANQSSNDRGLLSSSLAVGSAQNAVLDAATPIAAADASAINQNNQFNASNEQQAELQNATQAQRTSELNAAAENRRAETNVENAMRTNLANLDVSSRAFLADVEQKNKQLIQSSANAATLFNTYQQQVAQIMTSANLDATGKETAVKNLQTMLQDSLAAQDAISQLDLAGLIGIDTGGGSGGGSAGGGTGGATGGKTSGALAQWQSQVDALKAQIADRMDTGQVDGGSATRAGYARATQALKDQLTALLAARPQ